MNYLNHCGKEVPLGELNLIMRILITGGLGFIGGRLAAYLSKKGHQIILGSRNISEAPIWLPYAEVQKIEWDNELSLLNSCIGVDLVIHAAGMNASDCFTDPLAALNFNGKATNRLVKAAIKSDVKKFIYLSTAHVYANPLSGLITERSFPLNNHPYATSHLAGENSVLNFAHAGEMFSIVLRISNAFGVPKDRNTNCWMLLINDLCRQAVQKRKLVLKTNGLQYRDFIGLEQVCNVVAALAVTSKRSKGLNIFNLGSGTSKSVLEVAQLVQQRCKQVLNFEPELIYSDDDNNEQHPPLIYQNVNLSTLGINVNDLNNISEIDELLCYCQSVFSEITSAGIQFEKY